MGWLRSEAKAEDALSPVPGTVHLVDLDNTMHAKHAKGTGQSDIVLVPAPSSDLDDPVRRGPSYQSMQLRRLTFHTAQLVGIAEKVVNNMHVYLHADGRHCERCHLFRACAYLGGNESYT